MSALNYQDVENALLHFRIGRRVILDRILEIISGNSEIRDPVLLLSRLFIRLKSADSIVEKINRKKLPVQNAADIPRVMTDIIGMRIIAQNQTELKLLDHLLSAAFAVKARVDHARDTNGFGDQTLEYVLTCERDGVAYPFEVQLRTFLQHYWAGNSFFLFHKADAKMALPYQNDLLALSSALQSAEEVTERIQPARQGVQTAKPPMPNWQAWPLRNRVYLMIVGPHEQFVDERVIPLSGNDENDHRMVVQSKLACYEQYPDAVVVECMCANFATFLLNEPQVHVGPEYLDKVVW